MQTKRKVLYVFVFLLLIIITMFFYLRDSLNTGNKNSDHTRYVVNKTGVFSTNDWFNYSITDYLGNFSVNLPADWIVNGSVIYDINNKKLAEFSPGLVFIQANQSCFDSEWYTETGESELVLKKDIEINKFTGSLIVEKSKLWNGKGNDGYWYPYFYCISQDRKAFVMTFYENMLNNSNEQEHKKIIESLIFEIK